MDTRDESKKCQVGHWTKEDNPKKERNKQSIDMAKIRVKDNDRYSDKKGQHWTKKDLNRLARIIRSMKQLDWDKLKEVFPHRTKLSIQLAISRHKEVIKMSSKWHWSRKEEDLLLKKLDEGWNYKEIAEILPLRSHGAVKSHVRNYYSEYVKPPRYFKKEELEYMRGTVRFKTCAEIAEALKRDVKVVSGKLSMMGLRARQKHKRERVMTPTLKAQVIGMLELGYKAIEIANRLKIKRHVVDHVRRTYEKKQNRGKV